MQVHVNSPQMAGGESLQAWVGSAVADRLDRYDEFLSRVEVHVSDENGQKSGAEDKRCQIEARPRNHQPISVTHKAESVDLAVAGAAEKMRHALEHLVGRLSAKPASSGVLDDPITEESRSEADALLQQEFLENQEARDRS
ncbi:HPF/RaiA family ribosome-associated protein [Pseudomonas matsuisoli]|uniref:Ribosomal subunit interface protein n=1 Tax=Pseudomonas matsuisoli TaxID=1515666 RepID=A0A917UXN7_9PSED|nr:HPF/RaiA family ribosome-associated protein [Pseudomonas matsuisoli]GGJ95398.1 ribosomal subunit interface protein [Pseudomonas matsuisoli]